MKKKHYNARWGQAGQPSTANVSFEASHDTNASRVANKIARQLGVTGTPRTISRDNEVIESLTTGVSDR